MTGANDGAGTQRFWRRAGAAFCLGVAAAALALIAATPELVSNPRPTEPFYRHPEFYPLLVLAGLAALAALNALRLARGGAIDVEDEAMAEPARWGVVGATLALFALYALAIPLLGYALATAVFLLVGGIVGGVGRPLRWLLPPAMAIVLWAVFVLGLKVWFPAPALLAWIGLA